MKKDETKVTHNTTSWESAAKHAFSVMWGCFAAFCLVGFLLDHSQRPVVCIVIVTLGWAVTRMIIEAIESVKVLSEKFMKKS